MGHKLTHVQVDQENLAHICRAAAFFAVDAVAIPTGRAAQPNTLTAKLSSGGCEAINFLSLKNENAFVAKSRQNGWQVVAAMPPSSSDGRPVKDQRKILTVPGTSHALAELRREGPVLLILGGEEGGISHQHLKEATHEVSILRGQEDRVGLDSLNVGSAATLLFSELSAYLVSETLPATQQGSKFVPSERKPHKPPGQTSKEKASQFLDDLLN